MVNQLGDNGSNQRLIGSSSRASQVNTRAPRREGDVFVANNDEKRYLWTARAFAVITAVSLCCNIVLLLAIAQVIPLFRVEPFLLSFQSKDEQIYNIFPSDLAIDRPVVDVAEMEIRWLPGGPIQEMSSSAVYEDFVNNTAKRALDYVRQKGLQRSINILTVNEIGQGLWQVEYETRDLFPSSTAPEVNYWTASLQVTYRKKSVKFNDRLNNPVGFTVVKYSLMHHKSKTK